jgi:hypothetical protein
VSETPDPAELASSFVHLIQRFTGNQPDALAQMRAQIENERDAGKAMMERAQMQLAALDQLVALIEQGEVLSEDGVAEALSFPAPPLKTALLRVLNEDPSVAWHRDQLYAEVTRRGWGPGGANPRNTFTSRLRDLELESRVRRIDHDIYTSIKNEEGALDIQTAPVEE